MRLMGTTLCAALVIAAACIVAPVALAQNSMTFDAVSSQAKPKAKSGAKAESSAEPSLVARYGDWGVYVAAPNGNRICFALSTPKSQTASRPNVKRGDAYVFVATRPADKVANEVSVVVGYPLAPKQDATAEIGSLTFAMFTQNDGAWIKDESEAPKLVEAMRKNSEMIVKGRSARGTDTTDTYSLAGISAALDRVAKECGSK